MNRGALLEALSNKLGQPEISGDEAQFHCPFCREKVGGESHHRKLWVNLGTGKAICYRCGYKASQPKFLVRALFNGHAAELEALLALPTGTKIPGLKLNQQLLVRFMAGRAPMRRLRSHPLPAEYTPITQEISNSPPRLYRRAVRYLRERGITMEQVTRYRIGYCPDGPLARYLVFPIGHFQEDVYWTTRYCGDHDPKSKNPPNTEGYMRKQDVLFGFDNALGKEQVVVCEGPISAMAYPNGVALLGKTISPAQIALLDELVEEGAREIVISLDADARREATVVYQQLAGHAPKVTVVELDYGDPDDRKADLHLFLEKRRKIRTTDSLTRLLPTLG